MADEIRIKLIGAGLILGTIVLGFLIFTQKFSGQRETKDLVVPPIVPSPMVVSTPSPVTLGQTTKGGQLPATGFPTGLFFIFSAATALAGYGLRKFPD